MSERRPQIGVPRWARGLPLVSVGLAVVWLLAGLAVELGFATRAERGDLALRSAVRAALDNPALKVPVRLLPAIRAVMPGFESNEMFAFLRDARGSGPGPQQEFDAKVAAAFVVIDSHPHRSLGIVPSQLAPHAFGTHWLIHSGPFHLLATLVLWLMVGPHLERLWGWRVFIGMLAASGLLGAGAFALVHPHSDHAFVGASTLLASCMVALVLRFRAQELNFLGWLPEGSELEVTAPAWALGVLWAGYVGALWWVVPGAQPAGLGNAVGYTAQAAGLLVGALGYLVLGRLGWERPSGSPARLTAPKSASSFNFEKVLALRTRGESEQAFELLESEIQRSARNRDAVTTFWQMCIERGEPERAADAMHQLVREELRRGADEVAVAQWRELAEHLPSRPPDLPSLFRLVPAVRQVDGDVSAVVALQQLLDADDAALESTGLARAARLGEEISPQLAVEAARRALAIGTLADGPRLELEQLVARLSASEPDDDGAPVREKKKQALVSPPPNVFYEESDRSAFGEVADLSSLSRTFPEGAVFEALPRRFEAQEAHLDVAGSGDLALAYSRLRGIAVVGVHGLGPKPVVLVDLLIDGAGSERPLRVLRLRSDRFSPSRFFPQAGDPLEALRCLVKLILSRCEARPLPSLAAAELQPVRVFDDLEDYYASVLRPSAQDWA